MYLDYKNQDYQFEKVNYLGENLKNQNFSRWYFVKAVFRGAILDKANFGDSNLIGVHFQSTSLKKTKFRNAKIQWSKFEGANLNFADFQGSELYEANFNGAKLQGADFKDCIGIMSSSFLGAEYDKKTRFPEDFIPSQHGLVEKIKNRTTRAMGNIKSIEPEKEAFNKALDEIKKSINGRKGQPEFRNELIKNYGNRCAITGISMPGLEAAHIKPYFICEKKEQGNPANGILLRPDIHTLFDLGLIVIHPDYRVGIQFPLLETPYKKFNNQILRSVRLKIFSPGVEYLKWRLHNYDKHIGKRLRDDMKSKGLFDEILITASNAIATLNQLRESRSQF